MRNFKLQIELAVFIVSCAFIFTYQCVEAQDYDDFTQDVLSLPTESTADLSEFEPLPEFDIYEPSSYEYTTESIEPVLPPAYIPEWTTELPELDINTTTQFPNQPLTFDPDFDYIQSLSQTIITPDVFTPEEDLNADSRALPTAQPFDLESIENATRP